MNYYALVYDTHNLGILLACAKPPTDDVHIITSSDPRKLQADLFASLENKLHDLSGELFARYLMFLKYLHPKIIKYDLDMNYIANPSGGYIYVANPMGLPKYGVPVIPSIRQLVTFDVYVDIKNKFRRDNIDS